MLSQLIKETHYRYTSTDVSIVRKQQDCILHGIKTSLYRVFLEKLYTPTTVHLPITYNLSIMHWSEMLVANWCIAHLHSNSLDHCIY